MPDAGQIVKALDFPAEVEAVEADDVTGITGTDWVPGSPEVSTSFIAPTSGRVQVTSWMHGRVNTGSYLVLSFEADDNQDFSTPFKTGAFEDAGRVTSSAYESGQGSALLTGLSSGETYWVRLVHRTSSASDDADVTNRRIAVRASW